MRNHSDLSSRMRKRVTYKLQSAPFKNKISYDRYDHSDKCASDIARNELSPLYAIKSSSTENEPSELKDICNTTTNEQTPCEENILLDISNGLNEKDQDNESEAKDMIHKHNKGESPVEEKGTVCNEIEGCNFASNSTLPSVSMCNAFGHDIQKAQTECLIDIDECDNSNDLTTNTYVPNCNSDPSREHVVLVPLGSMQALAADSSDV